jgi:hypothetical protein
MQLKSEITLSQLEDAKRVIASQESLLSVQKSVASNGTASSELSKQLEMVNKENTALNEKLKAQAASLTELTNLNEKLKTDQAASEKAAKETKPVSGQQRVKIDTGAAKDTQTSYAIGSWYGQAADREKLKMSDLGKKFDIKAFTQGFNDKVNNQLQLPAAKISTELTTLDKQQQKQMATVLSENEKQSEQRPRTLRHGAPGDMLMPDHGRRISEFCNAGRPERG